MKTLQIFLYVCVFVLSYATTCATELNLRIKWSDNFNQRPFLAPSLIRMVFHDAIDFDNLRRLDGSKVLNEKGGVDFCMNNPLNGPNGLNNAHNRNLPIHMVKNLQNQKLFSHISLPDIEVLGALVAIEEKGLGPQIPFSFGRLQGPCKEVENCANNVNDEKKVRNPNQKGTMKWCTEDKFIGDAINATSFDSTHHRNIFSRWGFSSKEQVALMGAHSFGKLAVCAGGFNGIEHGPFCNKRELLIPPASEGEFECDEESCDPVLLKEGRGLGSDTESVSQNEIGFGDGAFFDQTPERFDNDYFRILKNSAAEGFDNIVHWCCGKIRKGTCDRVGNLTNEEDESTMGSCDREWCRSDRGGRTHFKNLKRYAEPQDRGFVRDPYNHGYIKRIVHLGADMALIDRKDTRTHVLTFANDQSSLFREFRNAYTKVINQVPSKKKFNTCVDSQCLISNGTYTCGGIKFKTRSNSQCKSPTSNENECFLIGGIGSRGIIRCGDHGKLQLCCNLEGGCEFDLDAFEGDLHIGDRLLEENGFEYEL